MGRLTRGEFRPDGSEREWCDHEVLRVLRRRSLAALRREIEPVETVALARFLPEWHSIDRPRRGADALVQALTQLQGAAIPASVLESDVLPSRVDGYSPADLDALLASGAIVWAGAGGLGAADGRVRLYFRDQAPLLFEHPTEVPEGPVHDAIRAHLATQGASFWPELFAASELADQNAVLAALWDLVWCGQVTNDTLAPVRGLLAGGKSPKSRGASRRGRPRPGQLTRLGPPSAAGRWSLTAPLVNARGEPNRACSFPSTPAHRASRGPHQRRSARRRCSWRVRRGLPGVASARRAWPGSSWLFRCRARRRPVRIARRCRSAPAAQGSGRRLHRRRPGCDRPCPALWRLASVASIHGASVTLGGCLHCFGRWRASCVRRARGDDRSRHSRALSIARPLGCLRSCRW